MANTEVCSTARKSYERGPGQAAAVPRCGKTALAEKERRDPELILGITLPRAAASERLDNRCYLFEPQTRSGSHALPGAAPRVCFINGLCVDGRDRVFDYSQQIADLYKEPVTLIANDQGSSVARDIAHAVAGKCSSSSGRSAEPAVESTIQLIKNEIAKGRNIKFIAYSQGAIILRNALDELRAEVGDAAWRRNILPRLEIMDVFGSPVNYWPQGVRARHFETSGDYIVQGAKILDRIGDFAVRCWNGIRRGVRSVISWFTGRKNNEQEEPAYSAPISVVRLPHLGADAHYLSTYLKQFKDRLALAH